MTLKAIEFFSGIGGMHFALKEASQRLNLDVQVIAAFDINMIANSVYEHNHGLKVTVKCVEHLPLAFYEGLSADLWMLSPPCQPFTKGGNMLDDKDPRSTGLLFLIDQVLARMNCPPRMLFLENVPNFEESVCHGKLTLVLSQRGYSIREYMLSPRDPLINIPNARLRYYLAAEKISKEALQYEMNLISNFGSQKNVIDPRRIKDFLSNDDIVDDSYAVPAKYITDYINYKHDIVHPEDIKSTTFTKAYGSKYIIGTGSFLQTKMLKNRNFRKDNPEELLQAGLRFFTETEISRLHGLPDIFEFPASVNRINRYRLLGNSLNIKVVAEILSRLLLAQ